MFKKILVANRGAIACREFRTLERMGIGTIAVYSKAGRHSRHVLMAGEAVCIGPAPVAESYLDIEAIIAACKQTGAERSLPLGQVAVESAIPGNVWKVLVEPGTKIEPGQVLVVVESMKMEMKVRAVTGGVVREVLCRTSKTVQAGQRLLVLEQEI